MRVVLCRVPHNSVTGISRSAYPLWAGYLQAGVRDLIDAGQIDVSIVDGEAIDFGATNLLLRSPLVNKIACAFFPRWAVNFEQLRQFAGNPAHPWWEIFLGRLLAEKPDVVAMTAFTNNIAVIHTLSRRLKVAHPGVKILVGGIHPTADQANVRDHLPDVDYFCIGEGEITFREFLLAQQAGSDPALVPGILSQADPGKYRSRSLVEDIDDLPLPNRTLNQGELYRAEHHIFSSRGCPYLCNFCSSFQMWSRKVRYHSVERVLAEMREIRALGGDRVIFVDDTFTLNRKRVLALMAAFEQHGFADMNIHVGARINTLDHELIDALKRGGVKSMSFGLETGSSRIQEASHKKLKREDIVEILKYVDSVGIHILTYFIVGHPGETQDDVAQTISLMRNIGVGKISVCSMQPLPGTDIYAAAQKRGFVIDPSNALKMEQLGLPAVNLSEMPDEVLAEKVAEVSGIANRLSQPARLRQAADYYLGKLRRLARA